MVKFIAHEDILNARRDRLSKKQLDKEIAVLVGDPENIEHLMDDNGYLPDDVEDPRDYRGAIDLVNTECELGMDETDRQMLELIYAHLKKNRRFGTAQRIPVKENPATHSLFCVPFVSQTVTRAAPTPDLYMRQSEQLAALGALVHDGGETLGEAGTLEEEANKEVGQKTKPEFEQMVFDHVLTRALYAIQTGDIEDYHSHINQMREQAGIRDEKTGALLKVDMRSVEQLIEQQEPVTLNPEMQKRHDLWLSIWEMVEMKKPIPEELTDGGLGVNQRFVGLLTNATEHIQGTSHVLRHSIKEHEKSRLRGDLVNETDADISPAYTETSFVYTESDLGPLFSAIQTPQDERLAREQAREIYHRMETMAEQFAVEDVSNISSRWTPKDPELAKKMASEPPTAMYKRMIGRLRGKIQGIYHEAAERVKNGSFTPGYMKLDENGTPSRSQHPEEGYRPEVLVLSRPKELQLSADMASGTARMSA